MEIKYTLTEKEKELLLLFKKETSLSAYDNFSGWRDTPEFITLSNTKLIYHYNYLVSGSVRYKLTDEGEKLVESLA